MIPVLIRLIQEAEQIIGSLTIPDDERRQGFIDDIAGWRIEANTAIDTAEKLLLEVAEITKRQLP